MAVHRLGPVVLALSALLTSGGSSVAATELPREAWSPGGSSILEAEIIPPAYRGRWAPSASACADVEGVQRLVVYVNGVDSYENGGRLTRITQAGKPRAVRLRLSYEGEGRFSDQEEVWTLSPDGRQLAISVVQGRSAMLIRCD
ncbi:MAG: hypothetical protein Q8J89_01885 [Caulobacter sp.]|nr:hypothetical protein [Caulobacter sp.]